MREQRLPQRALIIKQRRDVALVGECVFEMREFFGPGWRMYYVQRDGVLIIMLGGGDKSTQQADSAWAIDLAKTI